MEILIGRVYRAIEFNVAASECCAFAWRDETFSQVFINLYDFLRLPSISWWLRFRIYFIVIINRSIDLFCT